MQPVPASGRFSGFPGFTLTWVGHHSPVLPLVHGMTSKILEHLLLWSAATVPVVFDVLPDYLRDSCALTVTFILAKAFLYVLRRFF